MKTIRCDLPEFEQIELHPMADLHIGDLHSDFKGIMERIEHIKNTPNAYCILDGDLMDCAVKQSIGDIYGATVQPMEQLKHCVKLFKPLADDGKILAVLPGNHEQRIYRQDGIDMTELMCAQLGIPQKYSPTTALLFIRFGKKTAKRHGHGQCYSVYVTHGSGGGRKEGGKVNRLADLACIVDADCYITGHTHLPLVFKESYFRVNCSTSSVAPVEKLFCNLGASLGYGGYGDAQGFKPASKKSPVIYLDGTKHDMQAKL